MIRREAGQEYWLIAQHDHALISGSLARHLGNDRFDPPSSESAIQGIAMHDCGWPLHDEHPTLNPHHQPLDVFESPRQVTLDVWERSVETALKQNVYSGLLVSLHTLALSIMASQQSGVAARSWNLKDPRVRFELNRFQHRMIEIQESVRKQIGMRTDQPLKHGLAENSSDEAERRLLADFRWLQAMDILSLCLCCTNPPFNGYEPMSLKISRSTNGLAQVNPWPFNIDRIEIEVPYRPVPTRRYADAVELLAEMHRAAPDRFTVVVQATTI